ncbi:MAG: HAD family phosphatase [Bryobacterales bacterium]|nr:HAD family phosphatase [Bryobacterales bacterium]
MIRTVIFDLGGVIVPLDFQTLYGRISERCAVPAAEIPHRIAATELVPLLETGRMSGEEFTERISESLGLVATPEEFQFLWNSLFPPYTFIDEDLLARIKKRHRLLLLSNTNALHFERVVESYPLLRQFDQYVLSYKVGALKPSPEIYQAAIASAGCAAEECFFTDDIADYVEGARRAGIDAVRFESQAQIAAELRARGVLE